MCQLARSPPRILSRVKEESADRWSYAIWNTAKYEGLSEWAMRKLTFDLSKPLRHRMRIHYSCIRWMACDRISPSTVNFAPKTDLEKHEQFYVNLKPNNSLQIHSLRVPLPYKMRGRTVRSETWLARTLLTFSSVSELPGLSLPSTTISMALSSGIHSASKIYIHEVWNHG